MALLTGQQHLDEPGPITEAADSSSSRNSRERSGLPDARAAGRRWRREDRDRPALAETSLRDRLPLPPSRRPSRNLWQALFGFVKLNLHSWREDGSSN